MTVFLHTTKVCSTYLFELDHARSSDYNIHYMKKAYGFTIVELLIVIVVIAVLAAVSVVAYRGVQQKAAVSSIDHMLSQASMGLETYKVEGGTYPIQLSDINIQNESGIIYDYTAAGGNFCISAKRDEVVRAIQAPGTPPASGTCEAAMNRWSLPANGAVVYDEVANTLTLNAALSGSAVYPLVDNNGKTSMKISYEVFATQPSVTRAPKGGTHINSSYFAADGVTPVYNRTGYQGNGDASCLITLNQWNSCSWSAPTGPDVFKVKFSLLSSPSSYTSDNIYKNIRIEVL